MRLRRECVHAATGPGLRPGLPRLADRARGGAGALVLLAVGAVGVSSCAPTDQGSRGGGNGGGAASSGGDAGAPLADAGGGVGPHDARGVEHAGTQDAANVDPGPPGDGGAEAGGAGLPGWELVWSDEFDQDGPPDPASWRFETGFVRNLELQWYQPANATVANGVLTIEGRREQVPNPGYQAGSTDWRRSRQLADYTSSSITTAGLHAFGYGRFEARARIDVRQGSWPAFWTVGSSGGWPGGGEVDIMEFYAGNVLANVCRPVGSTCGWSSIVQPVVRLGGAAWASQFHVWAMEWSAETIDLSLDGVLVNHFDVASAVAAGAANPYVAHTLTIILNLALGANGGDPTNTTFPMKYEVDYVRVYQRLP